VGVVSQTRGHDEAKPRASSFSNDGCPRRMPRPSEPTSYDAEPGERRVSSAHLLTTARNDESNEGTGLEMRRINIDLRSFT
jgi:hypothetical protein